MPVTAMMIDFTGTSYRDEPIAAPHLRGTLLFEIFLNVVLPIAISPALIYLGP